MKAKPKNWLCRIGLHRWKKGRHINGFLVRSCSRCPAKQRWDVFGWVGWKKLEPVKRPPRKKLHVLSQAEEQQSDLERRVNPL